MRCLIYQVATGSTTTPAEVWFESLRGAPVTNTEQAVEQDLQPEERVVMEEVCSVDVNENEVQMEPADCAPTLQGSSSHSSAFTSLDLQRTVQNQFVLRDLNGRQRQPVSTSTDDEPTLLTELKDVFSDIQQRYQANPEYFEKPLKAFVRRAKGLSTNSALVSALVCFGKYSGAGAALGKRVKSKGMVSCKIIGVQHTALARSKVLGGSKHRLGSGRPCKAGKENSQSKTKQKAPFCSQVLPRRKAPHCLSQCVSKNEALGKTHSAK